MTIHSRGRLYFGTVSSKRDRCRRGRRVLLKRNGLKYSSAISARKGTYRIKRTRRLRGRVYVTVTARGVCRSAKSRKITRLIARAGERPRRLPVAVEPAREAVGVARICAAPGSARSPTYVTGRPSTRS